MKSEFLRRQGWWIKRLAALPAQLLAFAILTFFLIRTLPVDPVEIVTGGEYTPETYLRVQKSLGLDGGIWDQLWRFLGNLSRLNLGNSLITGRPILADLAIKLPETLELTLLALTGTLLFTLAASYWIVMRPANPVAIALREYARSAGAVPEFVLGIVAIFIFYALLQWVPPPLGRLSPYLEPPPAITRMPLLDIVLSGNLVLFRSAISHLLLPLIVMVLAHAAILLKLLTADLEAALNAAPTRFRIACGVSRSTVLLSIYRRALPATITMIGNMFGSLFGGAIVIETLFSMDGMGRYGIEAVLSGDLTVIQAVMLLVSALSMVVFLLVDIGNMLVDPRRRPGMKADS
jgi:peptide/nickel transport system permease protein